eukprot:scaffold13892_cov56-Phaeocystis_antarctica.AAC.1
MKGALAEMAAGGHPTEAHRLPFAQLYAEVSSRAHVLRTTHQVGFHEHYAWEERFNPSGRGIDIVDAPLSGA